MLHAATNATTAATFTAITTSKLYQLILELQLLVGLGVLR